MVRSALVAGEALEVGSRDNHLCSVRLARLLVWKREKPRPHLVKAWVWGEGRQLVVCQKVARRLQRARNQNTRGR